MASWTIQGWVASSPQAGRPMNAEVVLSARREDGTPFLFEEAHVLEAAFVADGSTRPSPPIAVSGRWRTIEVLGQYYAATRFTTPLEGPWPVAGRHVVALRLRIGDEQAFGAFPVDVRSATETEAPRRKRPTPKARRPKKRSSPRRTATSSRTRRGRATRGRRRRSP